MSMDMGPAFEASAEKDGHATKAAICFDPFHLVQLAAAALEKVRRSVWQDLSKLADQDCARKFKGSRWALLKNLGDLTDNHAAALRKLKRRAGDLWRAYTLKDAFREIFAGVLSEEEAAKLFDS
jgi:transposase